MDKTSREQLSDEETEEILGTATDLTGVYIGQEMGSIQEILRERPEVAVGQDQFQEWVKSKTGLDVSDAENVIILQGIVQT